MPEIERPSCPLLPSERAYCSWGVCMGALGGVGSAFLFRLMGFKVMYGQQEALIWQLVFHAFMYGILGWLCGLFFKQRKQVERQSIIIEHQLGELKARQAQLVQSEKLAVVGALSASMAHEIRNPLGIIRSSASLIAEDLPGDHPGQRPLAFITDEIDRINGLIRQLLIFAKPKEPVLAKTDLGSLAQRALAFLDPEFRKRKIEVVTRIDASLPPVHADGDQVHQVLVGLLINAAQAIRERGTITIATARRISPAAPSRSAQGTDPEAGPAFDGFVELIVSDTGPGIAPENAERVFEPFFTTKKEGTGLGLAVARQIVDGHGGAIWADAIGGRGASIHLRLPIEGARTTRTLATPGAGVDGGPIADSGSDTAASRQTRAAA